MDTHYDYIDTRMLRGGDGGDGGGNAACVFSKNVSYDNKRHEITR